MKLNCLLVDVCLPDYWGGLHLAHVSIPVYNGMKMKDIKQSIINELREGAVCGNDDIAEALINYSSDNIYKAAIASVKTNQASEKR